MVTLLAFKYPSIAPLNNHLVRGIVNGAPHISCITTSALLVVRACDIV